MWQTSKFTQNGAINGLFRWAWPEKWCVGESGLRVSRTVKLHRKAAEMTARPLLGTHITLHRNAAERTARPLLGTHITYDVATSQFPHCLLA